MKDRTGVRGNFYALTSLQGVESTIKGLDHLIDQMPRALVAAVRVCTEEAAVRARSLAPRRTGSLITSISTKYFDEGTVGAVFVAPVKESEDRFSMRGMATIERRALEGGVVRATTRHRMFPRWIEFGTRKMDPHPYLLPASAASFSRLVSRTESMIARLVKDAET